MNVIFDIKLLTPEQINGTACGMCGFNYAKEKLRPGQCGKASVPAGYAKDGNLHIVMACADKCADRAKALDSLFVGLTDDDLRMAIGFIEVNDKEILLDALEHVIALRASGETEKISQARASLADMRW